MSLNNFHTNQGIAHTHAIYPSQQDRMNEYGLALHQPREWDIPNRVPVPRIRPAENTNRLMAWGKDNRLVESQSQLLTRHYVPMGLQAERSVHGDTVDSLLLYNGKWPRVPYFSRYYRNTPY